MLCLISIITYCKIKLKSSLNIHKNMSYLEEFLENIQGLPNDVKRNFTQLKELDNRSNSENLSSILNMISENCFSLFLFIVF